MGHCGILWFTVLAIFYMSTKFPSALGQQGSPCDGYDCGVGRECIVLQEAPCYDVLCPVFPGCRLSCDVILCKEGEKCENGECVEDPCYGVDCKEGFLCLEGECVLEPTCENIDCGSGFECYLQEVECACATCLPIATCRPIDKCADVCCPEGTICEDGECIASCENVECGPGEKCFLEEEDCYCEPCDLVAVCRVVDKCAKIRCRKGFYCDDGKCVANPTCDGVDCGPWYECYLEDGQCDCPNSPCPPVPTCRPTDRCAYIRCKSGAYCVDGKCVPNPTCKGVDCGPGKECYLQQVDCFQEPCPPIPSCRSIDDCDKCG